MAMKLLNALVSLLLAAFAAFVGLFFIGTVEMHLRMLAENFWGTFWLRLSVAIGAGLICAVIWWLLNFSLLKSGLVKEIALSKLAFLLATAVTVGALAGTLAFCF